MCVEGPDGMRFSWGEKERGEKGREREIHTATNMFLSEGYDQRANVRFCLKTKSTSLNPHYSFVFINSYY